MNNTEDILKALHATLQSIAADGTDRTETLESFDAGYAAECMAAVDKTIDDLARLREALTNMLQEFGQKFNVRTDYHKMVAFEAARTAIAKAEGGTI